MDIKHFYKYSQKEIVELFRDFIEIDLFVQFPALKGKISIVITGSVPSAHYDEYSDIDAEVFYSDEADQEALKIAIKEYKVSLRERKIPIQFHPAVTFVNLQQIFLQDWKHDSALREYSRALIVLDLEKKYASIKKQIKWYPKPILKEKIQYLFAESMFAFEDRFIVAIKRKNDLYARSVSHHIIKLLGNALLMADHQYPVFEKHLSITLKDAEEKAFHKKINELLITTDSVELQVKLKSLILLVEKRLIKDGWIKKETKEHWIYLRPKFQVEHC